MSELKVWTAQEIANSEKNFLMPPIKIYLKSEADKVIAELKAQKAQAEADKVIAEKDKELRHQKYKRCLAMAKYCKAMCGHYLSYEEPKWFWYRRWSERWLELAEQFKDGV